MAKPREQQRTRRHQDATHHHTRWPQSHHQESRPHRVLWPSHPLRASAPASSQAIRVDLSTRRQESQE